MPLPSKRPKPSESLVSFLGELSSLCARYGYYVEGTPHSDGWKALATVEGNGAEFFLMYTAERGYEAV